MQQACHTRAVKGCEDLAPILRRAVGAEWPENTKVFRLAGPPHEAADVRGSCEARAQRHERAPVQCGSGGLAHLCGSADALDQRAFAGSLLRAFRCSVSMHAGGALLTRIACFFTNESMPPRPPRPESLNDSHSAAP
jgi:hypothetical protein